MPAKVSSYEVTKDGRLMVYPSLRTSIKETGKLRRLALLLKKLGKRD